MSSNIEKDNTAIALQKILPDYLSLDFDTYVNRQISVLKSLQHFKDYNYEGSNIRLLLEWLANNSELNIFYLNQIAKNVFDDTAELYENKHRIAKLKGYNARGYISAWTDLTVKILFFDSEGKIQYDFGDVLYLPEGIPVYGTYLEDETLVVPFVTKKSLNITVTEDMFTEGTVEILDDGSQKVTPGYITFKIPIIQGEIEELTYTGVDIVNNKIILPFHNYNHDVDDNEDNSNSILLVNDLPWTRVSNFTDNISGLSENEDSDNVYQLLYDKFKRYIIEFSDLKNVPGETDVITIKLLKTVGSTGNLAKNTITNFNTLKSQNFVKNVTKNHIIPLVCIAITNENESSGGTEPQSMEDLTAAGKNNISSQERNVTSDDYKFYLESRSDIVKANAWGENEVAPWGNVEEYNKVHLSVIPTTWESKTILIETEKWLTSNNKEYEIFKPTQYSDDWCGVIETYLEPRKMIQSYEVFDLPEIIFFRFDIGLKLKRYFTLATLEPIVLDKLTYYFKPENQSFNNTISFMDIHNYIMDTTIKVSGKNWDSLKAVDSFVFRRIEVYCKEISDEKIKFYALPPEGGDYTLNGETFHTDRGYNIVIPKGSKIYPPNIEGDYPQYTKNEFMNSIENKLKVIKLGFNQFPVFVPEACTFDLE